MSSVAEWIRWEARCRNMPAHGVTAGDTYYLGLRDYVEMYPCPNGLPIDHKQPAEVPAWNDRVAKAKRDIQKHKSEQRVQLLAEQLSNETLRKDIEAIRIWANSLQQINHRSQTGSRELTQAVTN
jgi:hypothetical protein